MRPRDLRGAGGRRGGGRRAAARKLAGEATLFTAFGDDEVGHRSTPSCASTGCAWRVASTRSRSAAHSCTWTRTASAPSPSRARLGPAARTRCPGAARRDGRRLRDGGRPRRDAPGPPREHARRHPARAGHARRGPRAARRARVERPRPRGALPPGDLDPHPGSWCGPSAAGESGRRPAASGAAGGRRSYLGPVRDAYGAGDSFAAGLTYGSGRAGSLRRRSSSRPAAVPPALPARPLQGPARALTQATWPSAGSIGRPSLTQRSSPPSRLWASKPAAANAWAASADLWPVRQ